MKFHLLRMLGSGVLRTPEQIRPMVDQALLFLDEHHASLKLISSTLPQYLNGKTFS